MRSALIERYLINNRLKSYYVLMYFIISNKTFEIQYIRIYLCCIRTLNDITNEKLKNTADQSISQVMWSHLYVFFFNILLMLPCRYVNTIQKIWTAPHRFSVQISYLLYLLLELLQHANVHSFFQHNSAAPRLSAATLILNLIVWTHLLR